MDPRTGQVLSRNMRTLSVVQDDGVLAETSLAKCAAVSAVHYLQYLNDAFKDAAKKFFELSKDSLIYPGTLQYENKKKKMKRESEEASQKAAAASSTP